MLPKGYLNNIILGDSTKLLKTLPDKCVKSGDNNQEALRVSVQSTVAECRLF